MNMIPFIITLLVLSTVNADVQEANHAFASFEDQYGNELGTMEFIATETKTGLKVVQLYAYWSFSNSNDTDFVERLDDVKMYFHDSKATDGCAGNFYVGSSFNSYNNDPCTDGEFNCLSEKELQGPFISLEGRGSFMSQHITVEEILGSSVAMYVDGEAVYCADINQMIAVRLVKNDDNELGFSFSLATDISGVILFSAGYSPMTTLRIGHVQIRENPVIGGDCSTTGDIFNPAGHNGSCAYGDILCNEHRIGRFGFSGELPYMNMKELFCHAERSVVAILDGETEPYVCYNLADFEEYGPVVGCASTSPSASASASVPAVDVDDSPAFACGPHQGYFFAVVFCLCALYFQ